MQKSLFSVGLAALAMTMTGCAGFFSDPNTTTVTTSTSGDYVYIVNQTTDTLSEFSVGSSVLTAISGSPISLTSYIATSSAASIAVTRQNSFVYVGGQGGIACFSIGTGGALTAVSAGAITSTGDVISLATSPDGQWLLALDAVLHTLTVYAINTSTGALTVAAGSPETYPAAMNSNTSVAEAVQVAPNGAYVAVALGTSGDILYGFTTSSGLLGVGQEIQFSTTGNTTVSDNALAFDTASAYLYIARAVSGATGAIASYAISSTGVPSAVTTVAVGSIPYGVLVDKSGKYLYSANRGSGNVYGFAIASGTFTSLSGSPYAGGITTTALAEDNSSTYVVGAAIGGSYDYTLYAFDALTSGKLDAISVGASGTDPAGSVAVATTH